MKRQYTRSSLPRTRVISTTTFLLAWCFCDTAIAELPVPPKQMQARVVSVQDGDTILVVDSKLKQYSVQMDGIDAPELGQPYGEASQKHLERRISRKNVVLLWHNTSKDGTLNAKVMLNNGDINLLQLHSGSAWAAGKLSVNYSGTDPRRYANAQARAKEKQLGLWRDAAAISPADWRKQHVGGP